MRFCFRSLMVFGFLGSAGLFLAGCANSFDLGPGASTETSTVTMNGDVYGGFFPVSGAHVFLFSPGTTGVGGVSTSLIATTSAGALQDTTAGSITEGAYFVTTASNGGFSFTSTCAPGAQVYLYASNGVGTTGGANNPQIGLMAAVGTCPATSTVDAVPYLRITENSTVAAAYALAGFGNDPGHISTSGTALALVGMTNAMATANNLFNDQVAVNSTASSNGFPTATTTEGSTGTIPQTLLDTLSNILVACVNSGNSASATTSGCNTLRENATSDGLVGTGPTAPAVGSFSSDAPSDTATAMINIAHHPFANVSKLFGLQGTGANAVYKPDLGTAPTSFLVEVKYTGGGLSPHAEVAVPHQIAIDGTGNVWMVNYSMTNVGKFSALGVPLSGSTGFTSNATNCPLPGTDNSTPLPASLAIDVSGNAWIGFTSELDAVCELDSSGGFLFALQTGASPNGGAPYYGISDVAFDSTGNAWVTDSNANGQAGALLEIGGTSHKLITSKTGNGMGVPYGVAIDAPSSNPGHTGDIWVANGNAGDDSVFTSTGGVASFSPTTEGTTEYATGVAIDSSGYVWSLSFNLSSNNGFLSKTSPTGSSGSSYTYPSEDDETSIAMDGASNVWICNFDAINAGPYNVISEVNNSGSLMTPTAGFTPSGGTSGNPGNFASSIAIDGSGNVWYPMSNESTLRELVGAAIPVATPIAYGTVNNKLGARP